MLYLDLPVPFPILHMCIKIHDTLILGWMAGMLMWQLLMQVFSCLKLCAELNEFGIVSISYLLKKLAFFSDNTSSMNSFPALCYSRTAKYSSTTIVEKNHKKFHKTVLTHCLIIFSGIIVCILKIYLILIFSVILKG